MSDFQFPDGFVWGAATSAYQIEGAHDEDGRGESIWDRFSHTPGKIANGDTGDVACDHYHRYREDIDIMQEIGLGAYRFSISWSRVLPEGRGQVNQRGLDFYQRLVDGLLDAGIQPYATLYHWDLPQALQDAGGWPARDTALAFAEYAALMGDVLGDRVASWATLNEPYVSAFAGYFQGRHAPGQQSLDEMLAASHHLLLAHGLALPALRDKAQGEVGIVLNLQQHEPASESELDADAAWLADGKHNRWYLDPLAGRGYPADAVADFGRPMDFVQADDLEAIGVPVDYLGVNHYFRSIVRSEAGDNLPVSTIPNKQTTDMGWEVYPQGLYDILTRVHADYEFPKLYVSENGFSRTVAPDAEGRIQDSERIGYHRDYLRQAHRAIEDGAPLAGYFVWSLLDNFEWAHGFRQRFGLVHVDFKTLERTPKESAWWYRDVIRSNGETLAD